MSVSPHARSVITPNRWSVAERASCVLHLKDATRKHTKSPVTGIIFRIMEQKYDLPIDIVESLKREIWKHDRYKALEELRKKLYKLGQFAQAAKVKKDIEIFEEQALNNCIAHYKKNTMNMSEAISSMSEEDSSKMCVYSYASIMAIDALDSVVRNMKEIFNSYYPKHKFDSYDKLVNVVKEAKSFISVVNNLGGDDKYHLNLYGDSVDNVIELVVNKARSYMNKVNHHEESVNKKAARHAKVA